ncbi:MAG: hypothetical protein ACM4D3_01575 [Candidatus Sericytochromatia bacterium]
MKKTAIRVDVGHATKFGSRLYAGFAFAYMFVWLWGFIIKEISAQFVHYPAEYTAHLKNSRI